MLQKIIHNGDLNKIEYLFNDIRFFMGRSVLQGLIGEAYVDDLSDSKAAFLTVGKYCFISGTIEKEEVKKAINNNFSKYILIPSDNLCKSIEEIYQNKIIKSERYSMKKDVKFDVTKLEKMSKTLSKEYALVKIDTFLEKRIKQEHFMNITDDYKKYGIGYCCIYNDEIIGVASSNIFYKDGIEVNIRVKDEYRRKGIATAMASKLILECLRENRKVSWDAANMDSVGLAKKLGFEYDSTYIIYKFPLE